MVKGDFVYCPSFIRFGYPECIWGVVIDAYKVGVDNEYTMCTVLWSDGSVKTVLEEFLIKMDKKCP